ncbi:MAG: hypothetical protein ABFS18_02005 [Thermodesulfobacteriota bacterium]
MTILEPIRAFLAGYKGRKITLKQMLAAIDRPRRPVLRMLDQLAKEGYLAEIADNPTAPGQGECGRFRRNPTWRINSKKNISDRPTFKSRPHNLRDKMWTVIRARRRFTRTNLVILAGCGVGSAETYTLLLERDKIIRRIGKDGQEVLWMLVKDTGPKRPKVKEAAS